MTPEQERLVDLANAWREAESRYKQFRLGPFSPRACDDQQRRVKEAADAFWSAVDGYLAQRTGQK